MNNAGGRSMARVYWCAAAFAPDGRCYTCLYIRRADFRRRLYALGFPRRSLVVYFAAPKRRIRSNHEIGKR